MSRFVRCLVSLLILGGCRSAEPSKIGNAYPDPDGESPFQQLVQAALDSSAAGPRVEVRPWTLLGYTVERNADQAEVFASDPSVVAVVGPGGSRDALIGASVYNAVGLPQVVPTATSRHLASAGPWTFTMVPNDSVEGDFLARWAVDSAGARRVAVMYVGDEFGIGIRDGVRLGLRQRGIELADAVVIPAGGCAAQAGGNEIFAMIARAMLARSSLDAVVIAAGLGSGWCMIRQIHALDPRMWLLAADGVEVGTRAPEDGFQASRVRGVGFWRRGSDSLTALFVARAERFLGHEPTAGQALMYDAFLLLHHAIREVGPDRDAVRRYLHSLGRSRPPWIGVTGLVSFERPRVSLIQMEAPGRPRIAR
jgi:ABC-type branched-subunit amino acid transport system substrate-binding protein